MRRTLAPPPGGHGRGLRAAAGGHERGRAADRERTPTRRHRIRPAMGDAFTWQDGERTIRFGRGTIATFEELLGTGYTLLTTERAEGSAPDVVAAAGAVHHVRPGRVDEIAEELRETGSGELLVALGGGRGVDGTKAPAAGGRAPRRAAGDPPPRP